MSAKAHLNRVAELGCCVCLRLNLGKTPAELHHVAEGSSRRSDFAVVPLCPEHHRGKSGFHILRAERFCKLYRVPWEKEEGLLVWVNEDLARS
jgi:hypothetical protein